jgi:hypothetical protein
MVCKKGFSTTIHTLLKEEAEEEVDARTQATVDARDAVMQTCGRERPPCEMRQRKLAGMRQAPSSPPSSA